MCDELCVKSDIRERHWSNHNDGKIRYPVGGGTWREGEGVDTLLSVSLLRVLRW